MNQKNHFESDSESDSFFYFLSFPTSEWRLNEGFITALLHTPPCPVGNQKSKWITLIQIQNFITRYISKQWMKDSWERSHPRSLPSASICLLTYDMKPNQNSKLMRFARQTTKCEIQIMLRLCTPNPSVCSAVSSRWTSFSWLSSIFKIMNAIPNHTSVIRVPEPLIYSNVCYIT